MTQPRSSIQIRTNPRGRTRTVGVRHHAADAPKVGPLLPRHRDHPQKVAGVAEEGPVVAQGALAVVVGGGLELLCNHLG